MDTPYSPELVSALEEIHKSYTSGALEQAKSQLLDALTTLPNVFELKKKIRLIPKTSRTLTLEWLNHSHVTQLMAHQIALREGDTTKAARFYQQLREQYASNPTFKEYMMSILRSAQRQAPNDELFALFRKLSTECQEALFEDCAAYYEQSGQLYDACKTWLMYIKSHPQSVRAHGIQAANLAIRCEAKERPASPDNPFRRLLVTEILPVLFRSKLEVILSSPNMSNTSGPTSSIPIQAEQIQRFLELGQGYYLARKEWRDMFKFTVMVLEKGGYLRPGSSVQLPDPTTSQDFSEKLMSLLISSRTAWEAQHEPADAPIGIAFEFPAIAACFARKAVEYYDAVCCVQPDALRDDDISGKVAAERQTCLIPICALRPPAPRPVSRSERMLARTPGASTSLTPSPVASASNALNDSKRRRFMSMDDLSSRYSASQKAQISGEQSRTPIAPIASSKSVMKVSNLINSDDEETQEKGVNDNVQSAKVEATLNILRQASECLRFLEKLSKFHAAKRISLDLDQELIRLIERWNLPFDTSNAILLTRAELGLSQVMTMEKPSTSSNLQKALNIYREITARISAAWARHKQEKQRQGRLTPVGDRRDYDQNPAEESATKFDMPHLFSFRVLYCIAVIYMLVGWTKEARTELSIILSVMPFQTLAEKDFEHDDEIFSQAVFNHDGTRFRLMETTQQGLATRCLKHLVTILEADLDSTTVASPDLAGQLLVFVQYGWPYWHESPVFAKLANALKIVTPSERYIKYVCSMQMLQKLSGLSIRPLFTSLTPPGFNSVASPASSSAPSSPTSPTTPTYIHPLSPRVTGNGNSAQPARPSSPFYSSYPSNSMARQYVGSSGRTVVEPSCHNLAAFLREYIRPSSVTPARNLGNMNSQSGRITPEEERLPEADKKKRDSVVAMEVDETRRPSSNEGRHTLERKRSRALLEGDQDLTSGRRRTLAEQELSAGKTPTPYARSPFQPPNSSLRDYRDYRRGSDVPMGGTPNDRRGSHERRGSDASMESGTSGTGID